MNPEILESRCLLTAVPAFSSLPAANHTIYLDFDGHTVQGTSWNNYYSQTSLVAPAYDIDGITTSFNSTELAQIEDAWKRVSEDYRPFNVNVTTIDPGIEALRYSGSGDTQWGIRVIMTKESSMVTDSTKRTGAGGIAYIDSFRWSSDTPAWVYVTGGKNVAEAASHEVGHSLGLSHDGLTTGASYYSGHGSGETSWAPLMGVGYSKNVTQWDRGEYYNANNTGSTANYSKGADDLSIITANNGFSYRADDHGNSNGQASPLTVSGTSVSGSGIVETTSDLDVFSFVTGAGVVTLNISPYTPGPNLDIKADLYDSSGLLIASSNNSAVLSAGFNLNLAAGQYFVHVDGTGWGTPSASTPTGYSEYASLGQYFITGSVVASDLVIPQVSMSDSVVNENAGTVTFSVNLSQAATQATSVTWATFNGTATAGADYVSSSGTLSFAAGTTTASITVPLVDDAVFEATETFSVVLSSAIGLALSDGTGVATIIDDDVQVIPEISVNSVSVLERNVIKNGRKVTAEQSSMVFTVTLSSPASTSVSFSYGTADGTATVKGKDYKSASGTVTLSAGQTSATISVTILGDTNIEKDETFSLKLSNPLNAKLGTATGVGTILNDDGTGALLAKSERFPVLILDKMEWFTGEESHDHDHGHDHFDHDADEHDHDHPAFQADGGGSGWDAHDDHLASVAVSVVGLPVSVQKRLQTPERKSAAEGSLRQSIVRDPLLFKNFGLKKSRSQALSASVISKNNSAAFDSAYQIPVEDLESLFAESELLETLWS